MSDHQALMESSRSPVTSDDAAVRLEVSQRQQTQVAVYQRVAALGGPAVGAVTVGDGHQVHQAVPGRGGGG